MALYAIEIMLRGSVHVKATSLEQADRILSNTSSNTILGLDEEWFSDGPDAFRQRVTFSTRVKAIGSLPGAQFVKVSLGLGERFARSMVARLCTAYDGRTTRSERRMNRFPFTAPLLR
jgi:hypothetical protein